MSATGAARLHALRPIDLPSLTVRPDVPPSSETVWLVRVDAIVESDREIARRWLDDDERRRAASYVRAADRRLFEIAHGAARLVVGAALGVEPGEVVWRSAACAACGEPHGRPEVVGADVHFSLAHTHGLVAVAVASTPVGVDVERVPDEVSTSLTSVLHPQERAEIESGAPSDAPAAFARAWTRSEAYLKGLGVGLTRDPSLDRLGAGSEPVRRIDGWTVWDLVTPVGYAGAVAVPEPAIGLPL